MKLNQVGLRKTALKFTNTTESVDLLGRQQRNNHDRQNNHKQERD